MQARMLSCSVMSFSLRPHGLQPARLLCPWGFSRQEYWSGLPFPPPGELLKLAHPRLLHWQGNPYHSATWEAPEQGHDPVKQQKNGWNMCTTPSSSCKNCKKLLLYSLIYFALISFTWKHIFQFSYYHTANEHQFLGEFIHLLVTLQQFSFNVISTDTTKVWLSSI